MTKHQLSGLEQEILQGLQEILEGKAGRVLSADERSQRRRGRPPLPTVKVAVKLRLDADLLGAMRRSGPGWQTRANETLRREYMPIAGATAVTITVVPQIDLPRPEQFFASAGSAVMPAYYEPPLVGAFSG